MIPIKHYSLHLCLKSILGSIRHNSVFIRQYYVSCVQSQEYEFEVISRTGIDLASVNICMPERLTILSDHFSSRNEKIYGPCSSPRSSKTSTIGRGDDHKIRVVKPVKYW